MKPLVEVLCLPLCLVSLFCCLSAMAPSPAPFNGPDLIDPLFDEAIDWETAQAAGDLRRPHCGRFMNRFLNDVALLNDDQLVVMHAPSIHRSFVEITTGVEDIAVLPGWTGNRDGIVVATSTEVLVYEYTYPNGTWISTTIGTGFVDLDEVRVGSLDSDGSHDVLVLTDGGVAKSLLQTSPGSFVTGPQASIVGSRMDFDTCQLDSDAGEELVFATSIGLLTYDDADAAFPFALLRLERETSLSAHIETIQTGATQAVAWLFEDQNGSHSLRTADLNGVTAAEALAVDVIGLGAADMDGDGHDDLAISHTSSNQVMLLKNFPTLSPRFMTAPQGLQGLSISGSTTGALSDPLLADLNDDTRVDCVLPLTGDDAVNLTLAEAPDDAPGSMAHGLRPDWSDAANNRVWPYNLPIVPVAGLLTIKFENNHALAAADKIRSTIWTQPVPGSGTIEQSYYSYQEFDTTQSQLEWTIPLAWVPAHMWDETTYFINLQLVDANDNPGPTTVIAFGMDIIELSQTEHRLVTELPEFEISGVPEQPFTEHPNPLQVPDGINAGGGGHGGHNPPPNPTPPGGLPQPPSGG